MRLIDDLALEITKAKKKLKKFNKDNVSAFVTLDLKKIIYQGETALKKDNPTTMLKTFKEIKEFKRRLKEKNGKMPLC